MCKPKRPPPSQPPAPAAPPPEPAANVEQGDPNISEEGEREMGLDSRRRGRKALRIDLNVPGAGSGNAPNVPRG